MAAHWAGRQYPPLTSSRAPVTVSQHAAGAVAEGFWSHSRTGRVQHWQLTATVTDGAAFKPGCAHGAGLAIVRRHGRPADAFQWLSPLTLSLARGAHAALVRLAC